MKLSRLTALSLLPALGLLVAQPTFACDSCACHATPQETQADNAEMDIVDTAVASGSFETLTAALQAADLVDALKGDGPFTVFAPTDEAFAALPEGTVEQLLLPENRDQLIAILTYHVVPGRVNAAAAIEAGSATTLQGSDVTITSQDDSVMVNGATVISADIDTTNGVIHVIDQVILPPQ